MVLSALEVLGYLRTINPSYDVITLQKILYYSQCGSICVFKTELFSEPLVHWAHGPTVERVYSALKKKQPIEFNPDQIEEKFAKLIRLTAEFWTKYSSMESRTHFQASQPWISTNRNDVITVENIVNNFGQEKQEKEFLSVLQKRLHAFI